MRGTETRRMREPYQPGAKRTLIRLASRLLSAFHLVIVNEKAVVIVVEVRQNPGVIEGDIGQPRGFRAIDISSETLERLRQRNQLRDGRDGGMPLGWRRISSRSEKAQSERNEKNAFRPDSTYPPSGYGFFRVRPLCIPR